MGSLRHAKLKHNLSHDVRDEFDGAACKGRWHYLKNEYKKWRDSQRQTGADRRPMPTFGNMLSIILEQDDTVEPPYLLSQSRITDRRPALSKEGTHNHFYFLKFW